MISNQCLHVWWWAILGWTQSRPSTFLSTWRLTLDGNGEGGMETECATFQYPPLSQRDHTTIWWSFPSQYGKTAFLCRWIFKFKVKSHDARTPDFVSMPGIVTYEFQNGIWSNSTGRKKVRTDETFLWGGAEFVPFGPNGLIVMFGGESSQLQRYVPGDEQRSIHNITLFDPITKLWYAIAVLQCRRWKSDQVNDTTKSYEMLVLQNNQHYCASPWSVIFVLTNTRKANCILDFCIQATAVLLGVSPRSTMSFGVSQSRIPDIVMNHVDANI